MRKPDEGCEILRSEPKRRLKDRGSSKPAVGQMCAKSAHVPNLHMFEQERIEGSKGRGTPIRAGLDEAFFRCRLGCLGFGHLFMGAFWDGYLFRLSDWASPASVVHRSAY